MKIMAIVEYDGTNYAGFQIQPNKRTIQGEIERVLLSLTQEEIRITGAGRTDAGVHAKGQVIAFRTEWKHSIEELQRAMNALLPQDIAVRELGIASEDFHPRFSAKSRRYIYTILNRPIRSPLERHRAFHFPHPLNVKSMAEICRSLLSGTLDLASFASGDVENTVRTIYYANCRREGDFVYFEIVLNAAFSHLIRRLIGTLLWVGVGKINFDGFAEILKARDRRLSAPPAPPCGLCLVEVKY
jgi:tRNA pseudouridine38-40 synthase